MTPKRPVNLNLFTIAFPLPAIVSIAHRISGVVLFLAIPLLLLFLSCSLQDESGFNRSVAFLSHPLMKGVVFGLLLALFYHLVAGVRHLIMDVHFADSLPAARLSAKLIWVLTIIFAIMAGMWLW